MSLTENKITICFTGHRPNKLPGGYNWKNIQNIKMMTRIKIQIKSLIESYSENTNFEFITGGAIGIDQMCFAICYLLKKEYPNRIICTMAIPYSPEIHTSKWHSNDVSRYNRHLKLADKVIQVDRQLGYQYCGLGFNVQKLQIRNEYMVDHSNIIIAIWDGTSGGTYNCIKYARSLNKKIFYIRINHQGEKI